MNINANNNLNKYIHFLRNFLYRNFCNGIQVPHTIACANRWKKVIRFKSEHSY